MIKAVVFDFGGVIVNDHSTTKDFVHGFSKEFRIDAEEISEVWLWNKEKLYKGKISSREIDDIIRKNFNVDKFSEKYEIYYLKHTTPDRNILIMALKLKNNYRVALLSNMDIFRVRANRKRNMFSYFDTAVLSADVGYMKPEKEIFEILLKKLDVKPNEVVFVDDNEKNLRMAKRFGMEVVLFRNYEQMVSDLKRFGVGI